jgi:magnesium chelatase family protein
MLARRLPGILPALDDDEALELMKIHSAARRITYRPTTPPARMPHHTCSVAGMIGGGNVERPGEISLAHRGLLVLDELPEFPRAVIDALVEPLETHKIQIHRRFRVIVYPADFLMLGAMFYCPCGYTGDPERQCVCSQAAVERYQGRVGPLLYRFDMIVPVLPAGPQDLKVVGESTATIAARVKVARQRQRERFYGNARARNSEAPTKLLMFEHDDAWVALKRVDAGPERDRVHRLAQTIADLDVTRDEALISAEDIALAIRLAGRQ